MSDLAVNDRVEVPGVDRATMSPLVRRVLDRETASIVDWKIEPVHGGFVGRATGSSAIYRACGTARDGDTSSPWSIILKISRLAKPEPDLHVWLWNSEPFAYGSGLLADLPGDLAAPRCFGLDRRSEDTYWIWLEDVVDDGGPDWPLERYALAARHLGQLNGAYLVDRPLPNHPWLNRGFYRAWTPMVLKMVSGFADRLRDYQSDSLVRRACPPDLAKRVLRLWDELPTFYEALDRLPQTFCHLDAYRGNLIARRGSGGRDQTVAIDWPTAGLSGIGVETAAMMQLAPQQFESFLADGDSSVEEFEAAVFDGYLEGLRDVGWSGDWRLPRFGHLIGLAFRVAIFPAAGVVWLSDPVQRDSRTRRLGQTAESLADRYAAMGRLGLRAADEARSLLERGLVKAA